ETIMPENLTYEEIREFLTLFGNSPYLQALVAIVLSFVIAYIVGAVFVRVIAPVVARTSADVDDVIVRNFYRPIFFTLFLFGFSVALRLIQLDPAVLSISLNILKTILIVVWLVFLFRITTALLEWLTTHPTRFQAFQPTTRPLFEIAANILFFALGIYFILISWNINPTGWLASAGIVALAVGLAAQETLGNLFAGISILADSSYKVGDYIVLDQKERGRVTQIGLRSTRILTRDDVEITIPNALIARSKIINESGGPWTKQRLKIPVPVAYGSDPEVVKEILLEVAKNNEYVEQTPEPWVKFAGFGESSLDFEIRCWILGPSKG